MSLRRSRPGLGGVALLDLLYPKAVMLLGPVLVHLAGAHGDGIGLEGRQYGKSGLAFCLQRPL